MPKLITGISPYQAALEEIERELKSLLNYKNDLSSLLDNTEVLREKVVLLLNIKPVYASLLINHLLIKSQNLVKSAYYQSDRSIQLQNLLPNERISAQNTKKNDEQALLVLQNLLRDLFAQSPEYIRYFSQVNHTILRFVFLDNPLYFFNLQEPEQKKLLASFGIEFVQAADSLFRQRGLIRWIENQQKRREQRLAFFTRKTEPSVGAKQLSIDAELAESSLKKDQCLSLQSLVNEYKKRNFDSYLDNYLTTLLKKINEEQEMTLAMVEKLLQKNDRARLFSSLNCEMAKLHYQLFDLLAFGTALMDEQKKNLVKNGVYPPVLDHDEKRENFIRQRIQQMLMHPFSTATGYLDSAILAIKHQYDSLINWQDYQKNKRQAFALAKYQQLIINKGLAMARSDANAIFDLQGHVLLLIQLTEKDLDEFFAELALPKQPANKWEKLAECIGVKKLTTTIFCKLDITHDSILYPRFLAEFHSLETCLKKAIACKEQNSVIPLVEEMIFHANLCLRAVERFLQENNYLSFNEPLFDEQTRQIYSQQVYQVVKKRLMKLKSGELNSSLDKLRPDCAQTTRAIFFEFLARKQLFVKEIINNLDNNYFLKATSTGFDYLRSDTASRLVSLILATNNTSHHKLLGDSASAFRLIMRSRYAKNSKDIFAVTPFRTNLSEARVPSLAVLAQGGREIDANIAVADVKQKFFCCVAQLKKRSPGYHGPIIYQLLTSLYNCVWALTLDTGNRQRQSADVILQGAHQYNREQLRTGHLNEFIYVKNIPVNQHTQALNSSSCDTVIAEASMMVDVAFLALFNFVRPEFPPLWTEKVQECFEEVRAYYHQFLQENESYLAKTKAGNQMLNCIEKIKKDWANCNSHHLKANSWHGILAHALFRLWISNSYKDKTLGMMVAAISITLSTSMNGCKSGNERQQAVAGRVALLKSMDETCKEDFIAVQLTAYEALERFAEGWGNAVEVKIALDAAYNQCFLYTEGGCCFEELGASSKIQSSQNHLAEPQQLDKLTIREVNTNIAESPSVTRLKQKNVAGMQAHRIDWVKEFRNLQNKMNENVVERIYGPSA